MKLTESQCRGSLIPELRSKGHFTRLSNHFLARGRRCGQPGQQHGRRFPALSSSTARWMLRLRVVPCLAEMTQQIHSFRASGVRSFQAARVVTSERRVLRISSGVLCTGPGLVSFLIITRCRLPIALSRESQRIQPIRLSHHVLHAGKVIRGVSTLHDFAPEILARLHGLLERGWP